MPRIELLPAVQELDARIRGRLIDRVCRRLLLWPTGSFVFAGWLCVYRSNGEVCRINIQEIWS